MEEIRKSENIRKQLIEAAEADYCQFTSRLLPGTDNILGIRLPVLRKIAKKIAKEEGIQYLETAQSFYFEEIMLQGLVIGYSKCDINIIFRYAREFIPKINNWSVCDSFCSSLKIGKEYKSETWRFLQPYFRSNQEFEVRFAMVMLIFYFVEEDYVEEILQIAESVSHEGYYVKMAVAWAISICFVKFEEITKPYLENSGLDDFTYNKALQKIVESNQISEEKKTEIRLMKRSHSSGNQNIF